MPLRSSTSPALAASKSSAPARSSRRFSMRVSDSGVFSRSTAAATCARSSAQVAAAVEHQLDGVGRTQSGQLAADVGHQLQELADLAPGAGGGILRVQAQGLEQGDAPLLGDRIGPVDGGLADPSFSVHGYGSHSNPALRQVKKAVAPAASGT